MKMRKSFSGNSRRRSRKRLVYVKSVSEIPDFRSDDEIAAWYQTHSTVLIQDQLASVTAKAGGTLRSRVIARRGKAKRKPVQHSQPAKE